MNHTRAITNEFAKMRHLRTSLFVALLTVAATGMAIYAVLGGGVLGRLDDPGGHGWKVLLSGLSTGASLVSPVLLAVLASRQVEIEHTGHGWLSSSTAGLTPGRMCRAKLGSLGVLVTGATVSWGVLLITFGMLIGITEPAPLGRWAGSIGALVITNLAVLAFHIVLSAKVENQLASVGVGLAGILLAIFSSMFPSWLAHLVPWGYYSLTVPADYVGLELVYLDVPYLSVLGLAAIGGGLFLLVTGRFDRQEA